MAIAEIVSLPSRKEMSAPWQRPTDGITVAVVGCAFGKAVAEGPAKNLYTSYLFRQSRKFAEAKCDRWVIASGLHHILDPESQILPYDYSLLAQDAKTRDAWADRAADLFCQRLAAADVFGIVNIAVLCGQSYAAFAAKLPTWDRRWDFRVLRPLSNMGIGLRLKWLAREIGEPLDDRAVSPAPPVNNNSPVVLTPEDFDAHPFRAKSGGMVWNAADRIDLVRSMDAPTIARVLALPQSDLQQGVRKAAVIRLNKLGKGDGTDGNR